MRVIKNNVGKENNSIPVEPPDFPREETCEYCDSVIELEKKDTYIGEYGYVRWKCPCCGRNNSIDDLGGEELTPSHFHYPQHFTKIDDEYNKIVYRQTDEEIENHIKDLIKYIRNDRDKGFKDDDIRYAGTSDTLILVDRYSGDDEYYVVVAKDYQETFLKFEDKDYD